MFAAYNPAMAAQSLSPRALYEEVAELLRQTGPTLRTADVLTCFTPSQMAV